ncbi:MAG TPA: Pycsar system effector family protein [Burkholderiaceae bacterium]|nr:Pycsar system effector family protein [Burkholderiaceae bacterium]
MQIDDAPIQASHPPLRSLMAAQPTPLSADQLLRSLETTLARLVATGSIADSRAGLVISTNIAMLGALVAMLSGTDFVRSGPVAWFWVGATAFCSLASIAMATLAAFPRPRGGDGSVVFFGSIASMSREEYFARLQNATQLEFARDLAEQCHRVATLATFKFRWVRRAMMMLLVASAPWLVCLELAGRLRLS